VIQNAGMLVQNRIHAHSIKLLGLNEMYISNTQLCRNVNPAKAPNPREHSTRQLVKVRIKASTVGITVREVEQRMKVSARTDIEQFV
jgi:hypothetical protein